MLISNENSRIFIVAFGLSLSVWMYLILKNLEDEKIRQIMRADAESQFLEIEKSISFNFEVLDSIKSLYDVFPNVTRKQFSIFVSPLLKQYSNAQALEWIPYVPYAKKREYEERAREEGFLGFSIKEKVDGVISDAGIRDAYFPVYYVEPLLGNEAALGFDLASNARRLSALEASRDGGEKVATAPITLVQETKKQTGLLIFNPVYLSSSYYNSVEERRQNLKGFVLMVLRVGDMLNQVLEADTSKAYVQVIDATLPAKPESIYHSNSAPLALDKKIIYKKIINLAGRQWEISVSPNNEAYAHHTTLLPWAASICGVIVTGLLFIVFKQMSLRQQWIEGLVEEKTSELQESDAFGELMLSSIPDFIFVKDKDFRLIKANPAFLQLYPESMRDTVIGTTTVEHYNKDQADEFLKHDKEAFEKGYSETYETINFPNGTVHTLLTKKVRFENNKGEPFILGVARDVTERENLIHQLTQSNEELDEFAYIASHDLKEPLRGIHNHASMYLRTIRHEDEEGHRRLTRIVELSQYMEALISDLLYFSRMGRTDIAMQETDMKKLVGDIISSMSIDDDPNVNVKVSDSLPTIVCDKVRVGEVFRNLIQNALKYQADKKKEIVVGSSKQEINGSKQKVFYVKDNGIGIDDKFHEEIFRIFKRLHKKTDYGGGTGVGLTFVKKIIERHGGQIWLESKKGQGTTFYFTLSN